jgi:phosphoglycerate dehydrogenase-like enzyme
MVVGMGSIGRELEHYLSVFGTTLVGAASRAREDLRGIDELPELLPEADAVVVLAPLTDTTRGLIGAAELAAMRDGALLVNAARGAVVDTDALVAEVTTGRLRAVLDVTDPEPLPDGHPLWSAPGVLSITPHLAGDSPASNARARGAGRRPARAVLRGPGAAQRRPPRDGLTRDVHRLSAHGLVPDDASGDPCGAGGGTIRSQAGVV